MKERVIIIFVAIIAGLFITSAGFFIYQSTKKVNDSPIKNSSNAANPTPIPENKLFVRISEPADETLTTRRTVVIKGSTNPDNIIVASSNLEDVQGKPTQDGEFSVTIDIDAGANPIIVRAIAPDGSSVQEIRTVTYSTEEF